MLGTTCPRCGSRIGPGFKSILKQNLNRRHCPDCSITIELANSAMLTVFNGLLFGAMVMLIGYWGFHEKWIRVAIAVPVSWLITPFIIRLLGEWEICCEKDGNLSAVEKWSGIEQFSQWIFGTAAATSVIQFGWHYRDMIASFLNTDSLANSEQMQSFTTLPTRIWLAVAVSSVALIVTFTARLLKMRAGKIDNKNSKRYTSF